MSVSGVQRQHGLGGQASHLPGEPARRRIEPGDIAFARACRAKGWGWQTIGNLTRLNAEDLRLACEPPKAAAPAKSSATLPGQAPSWLRALVAIDAGVKDCLDLARAVKLEISSTQNLVKRLKEDRGYLTGDGRFEGWTITAAGRAAMAAAARGGPPEPVVPVPKVGPAQGSQTTRLRVGTRQADALLAIAAGDADRRSLAAVLGVSGDNANVVKHQLRLKGFVTAEWTLTPEGLAEVERQKAARHA